MPLEKFHHPRGLVESDPGVGGEVDDLPGGLFRFGAGAGAVMELLEIGPRGMEGGFEPGTDLHAVAEGGGEEFFLVGDPHGIAHEYGIFVRLKFNRGKTSGRQVLFIKPGEGAAVGYIGLDALHLPRALLHLGGRHGHKIVFGCFTAVLSPGGTPHRQAGFGEPPVHGGDPRRGFRRDQAFVEVDLRPDPKAMHPRRLLKFPVNERLDLPGQDFVVNDQHPPQAGGKWFVPLAGKKSGGSKRAAEFPSEFGAKGQAAILDDRDMA